MNQINCSVTSDDSARLLVVASESPWPASHGGRVDISHRYAGLGRVGWTVGLIFWDSSQAGATSVLTENLRLSFAWVKMLARKRGLAGLFSRAIRLLVMPSQVASQHLSRKKFAALLAEVNEFQPRCIIAEGAVCGVLAKKLASAAGVPLVVRSHNIEHKYMRVQLGLARSLRQKLSILASLHHLRRYEYSVISDADVVWDISADDAEFWRAEGVKKVEWVPTLIPHEEPVKSPVIPWSKRHYDAVYLGNLWSPNNVDAVLWLVDRVMPLVHSMNPNFSLLIAGSQPSELIRNLQVRSEAIQFLFDPVDADLVRAQARILVNPIRRGGGLNTKSIESLYTESILISTPFALNGMDEQSKRAFHQASTPEDFAVAMLALVPGPFAASADREAARRRFGFEGIKVLSSRLRQLVLANGVGERTVGVRRASRRR